MAEGLISENQLNSWRNEFFYKNLIFNYLSQFCIKSFSFSHCIVKKKKRFLAQNTLQKIYWKGKMFIFNQWIRNMNWFQWLPWYHPIPNFSPQKVKERMICQSIIGNSAGKEKIMLVDVIGEFIQPMLEFSDDCLQFTIVRVR